jgi:hypothetical protein
VQALDNKKFKQGDIVFVSDKVYGSYIGRFVGKHSMLMGSVNIQILACTSYPSQTAIFTPAIIFERRPFAYGSINPFDAKDVEAYSGIIPGYRDSEKRALDKAISEARQQGNVNITVKLRNHLLDIA